MSTDRDVEQLMDALVQGVGGQMPRGKSWNLDKALEPLLPVVDRIANERTAAALEAAAKEINEQRWRNRNGVGEARDAERVVRDRATALRASNGEGTTT